MGPREGAFAFFGTTRGRSQEEKLCAADLSKNG